jgi:hypothetical protein
MDRAPVVLERAMAGERGSGFRLVLLYPVNGLAEMERRGELGAVRLETRESEEIER